MGNVWSSVKAQVETINSKEKIVKKKKRKNKHHQLKPAVPHQPKKCEEMPDEHKKVGDAAAGCF